MLEHTRFYLDAYLANRDEIPLLREAYALSTFWNNAELKIGKDDLIVGIINSNEAIGFHYGSGTFIAGEINAIEREVVSTRAYKYADPEIFSEQEIASIEACASSSTFFGGHAVLDFERVLEIGLDGYYKDIKRLTNGSDFYLAMEVILQGVVSFITRLAAAADTTGCAPDVSASLLHIAKKPPETFHQALQLVWVLHYLDNSDSFGRFDSYLLPFYEKESNRNHCKALLKDFWRRIDDAKQIQNMTIGGNYSSLTLLCINITQEMALTGPNLCLLVTPDIPDEIFDAALSSIGSGIGLPALYNEEIYKNSLIRAGFPEEAAQDLCFAGCSQVMIPGRSNFANDIGLINIAKIFELTLYDGYDHRTNRQVGLNTGKDFAVFDDFYNGFMRQLEYACDLQVSIHNKELPYRATKEGYSLRTLFIRNCLQNEKGYLNGGAEFNSVQLEMIGITNAADSLYAVKKGVFDEKRVSFAELLEVLRSDWGKESVLQKYFYALPKFGNDFNEVDDMRSKITAYLYERFNNEPGPFGGIYIPGEVIFISHDHCGAVTGATPDGRFSGEVLADSAGASRGCSRSGPTALLNSMLTLPVKDYLLTSAVLNMRFLPEILRDPKSREGVASLIRSFFAQGGMQLQVNVCDADTLKKAQQNPDGYKDLIVRVGGYSDYFVNLSKALQDEIIQRVGY